MKSLEAVLADWRSDAVVLRRNGHAHDADLIERLCKEVDNATEDWRTWLSESDAQLRSGRSARWLRSQFAEWEAQGHAEIRRRIRYYRQVVVPQRSHVSAAYAAGRDAAIRAAADEAARQVMLSEGRLSRRRAR